MMNYSFFVSFFSSWSAIGLRFAVANDTNIGLFDGDRCAAGAWRYYTKVDSIANIRHGTDYLRIWYAWRLFNAVSGLMFSIMS